MLNGWSTKFRKAIAYKGAFSTVDGKEVLKDLARFCHADRTSLVVSNGKIDPIATAVAEGRREVWLRIADFNGLTSDQMRLLADQASQEENR